MRKMGLATHLRSEAPGPAVHREAGAPGILITPAKRNVKFRVSDEKMGLAAHLRCEDPGPAVHREACAQRFSSLCTSQQKLDTNIIFFFSKDPIIVQCYASSASLLFG